MPNTVRIHTSCVHIFEIWGIRSYRLIDASVRRRQVCSKRRMRRALLFHCCSATWPFTKASSRGRGYEHNVTPLSNGDACARALESIASLKRCSMSLHLCGKQGRKKVENVLYLKCVLNFSVFLALRVNRDTKVNVLKMLQTFVLCNKRSFGKAM